MFSAEFIEKVVAVEAELKSLRDGAPDAPSDRHEAQSASASAAEARNALWDAWAATQPERTDDEIDAFLDEIAADEFGSYRHHARRRIEVALRDRLHPSRKLLRTPEGQALIAAAERGDHSAIDRVREIEGAR